MSEEKGLTDRIKDVEGNIEEIKNLLDKKKSKNFRMFTKGLLGKRRLKMGYVIIVVVNENGSVVFKKEPIVDSVIKIDETYHVVYKENLLVYKNKPFVILFKNKLHVFNPDKQINETYGQKYVLARMLNEAIKPKNKIGAMGGWILLLLIAGGVAYYFFGGGAG